MKSPKIMAALAIASALTLAGCAEGNNRTGATLVGAGLGGLLGSQFGSGDGRLAMTASMLDAVSGESWAGVYVTDMGGQSGCMGDLDGDGAVGGADLGLLLTEWGCVKACAADLDGDGTVGGSDLGLMMTAWGPCR